MTLNNIIKTSSIGLLTLLSASVYANQNPNTNRQSNPETWYDMSDPRAIYSGISVSAGSEGVNLAANYGSYLNGQYKQQVTVQAINDLDYYTADYKVLNANNFTGFSVESAWDRDLWDLEGFNDVSGGIFTKIPMANKALNFYPKLNLGLMWGDDINTTAYIKFDATTRYSISRTAWVGVTPTYTYSMKGVELSEFQATLDAGIQLSAEFAFAAHVNTDEEFWFDVVFTF